MSIPGNPSRHGTHSRRLPAGTAVPSLLCALLLAADAGAQTLYAIEGTGPSIGQLVGQGTCGTPTGPFVQVFAATQPFAPCPAPTSFAPPAGGVRGDVAVDHVNDRVWATDGVRFARYRPDGVIDLTFILPIGAAMTSAVTGLGFDSTTGQLWATDGDQAARIVPGLSCTSPTILGVVGFGAIGLAQDIEYDACSATFYVVTNAGWLQRFNAAGALISNVFLGAGPCALGANLTGLAFDTGNGTIYVTDGMRIAHLTTAGAAAAPEFSFQETCETIFPVGGGPPAPISGLAYSLRPVRYGAGSDPVGGAPVPATRLAFEMTADPEQSVSPNADFALGVEDATPGGDAYVVFGVSAPCTPVAFKGCALWVNPPFFLTAGPLAVNFAGQAVLPAPIGAYACGAAEIGITVHAQWLIRRPAAAGGWESSEAVAFTLGRP